ncbi:putative reverse transcriptase domain-containing protein [Tanacetum coccineum]
MSDLGCCRSIRSEKSCLLHYLRLPTLPSRPILSQGGYFGELTRSCRTVDEDEREPMFIQPHDPDYVPEPIYPEYIPLEDEHEFLAEEQPLPPVVSPTAESPGYVVESDPEEDPEEYEDDETEDGPVDYPMDGGEDGDDDDGDSSGDDADDEDEDEEDEDEEDEEEEEEHLAPADSAVVVPTVELVSPPEGTEPVTPPPSTDITTTGARITVRLQASISLPPEAEVERLLAMPTPPPSLLISLSPPSAGERLARIASTQALVDAVTAALPSPPLPPLPPSLYIPPPIDRRDDIPESEQPPRKRSCLFALGLRYEVGESSTARPTEGRGVYAYESQIQAHQTQLQLQGTLIQTQHQVHETRSQMQQTEMAELRETDRRHKAHMVKFATCTLLGAALTWWNGQIRTLGPDAYSMTWEVLKKKLTNKYCPQGEIKKLEIELWNLKVKGNDVPTYTERFQELTLICTKFVTNETEKVDKYINGLPDNIYGNVKFSRPKTLDETIELANDLMDQILRTYAERGSGNTNVANTQRDNRAVPKGNGCFKCGAPGHFKREFPKLKNKDGGNGNAQGWVYAVGNVEKNGNTSRNSDSNVVMGTLLLNNRYASILFDTSADRSFISTAFSSLIDIAPTPLENSYDVELADRKIVGIDTIIRGCTLNFLNHPFNIDLMPVELGGFDVIIGMDRLRRCHVMIVCDEKLVRIPYGNETLIFCSNKSNNGRESRLTIISCSKAQEYIAKGSQIFLAQISAKKEEDKSEGKQLKDVPIVRDFTEVFPEDLPGLPPARPVEF